VALLFVTRSAAERALHHQDVLPDAVEPAVVVVDADVAPPAGPKQGDARFVRREDLRDQLVAAIPLGLGDERLE
jgi:hypothetical protein